MLDSYKFSIPIPIRWNDLDPLGHVNNIFYFEYFQIARSEYMPAVSSEWDWNKHMFVIAHIECDYIKEITLQTRTPRVHVKTSSLSNKSFEMEYIISSTLDNKQTIVHAKGKSINVMVDPIKKQSIEIPGWLRTHLNKFEQK